MTLETQPLELSLIDAGTQVGSGVGFAPPWVSYIAMVGGEPAGTCGFKSAPDAESVEIAYYTFPGFEGRGVATEMTAQLLALAGHAHPGAIAVAQTLVERNASHRVLEKLGFDCIGTIGNADDVVLEWQRP
ncbi:MAG: GNAT family N-acetyltransferase, partial [Steroidobacteraceae bacterium]